MKLTQNIKRTLFTFRRAIIIFSLAFLIAADFLSIHPTTPYPKMAHAATPAVDAITNGPIGNTSITWQHTVGTNSNRLLLVTIQNSAQAGSTATYNGIAMTRRRDLRDSDTVGIAQFYLLNPPSGQHAIVINGGNRLMGSAIFTL